MSLGTAKRRRLSADMEEQQDANALKSLVAGTFNFAPDQGPGSLQELWHWPAFALGRLCHVGVCHELQKKFQLHGIVFCSDYSGVGTAEAAMCFLRTGANRRGCVGPTTVDGRPTFQVSRCGEVNGHCRRVLGAHQGASKAECSVAALFWYVLQSLACPYNDAKISIVSIDLFSNVCGSKRHSLNPSPTLKPDL